MDLADACIGILDRDDETVWLLVSVSGTGLVKCVSVASIVSEAVCWSEEV